LLTHNQANSGKNIISLADVCVGWGGLLSHYGKPGALVLRWVTIDFANVVYYYGDGV